jgi:hypothetical protein
LAAGYVKTQGSSGFGAVSTVATIPIADVTGTVPIAQGGTNLTTAPANKIPVGDGSTYLQKEIVGTLPIVVTNSAGNITLSAPSIASFNYVTFTRRVTGTPGSGAPDVGASLTKNPFSLTDFPSGSWNGIDTASGFTASTGRFTAALSGYYRIDVALMLSAYTGTASSVSFRIRKNGVTDIGPTNSQSTNSTSISGPFFIQYIDQATAGDYYEVLVTTGALNGYYVREGASFSVQRIQA